MCIRDSGRIERGQVKQNQEIVVCDYHDPEKKFKSKVVNIYQFDGLKRVPCTEAKMGDIVCISGIENISIGDTLCATCLLYTSRCV